MSPTQFFDTWVEGSVKVGKIDRNFMPVGFFFLQRAPVRNFSDVMSIIAASLMLIKV